jgi:hypothetical protein
MGQRCSLGLLPGAPYPYRTASRFRGLLRASGDRLLEGRLVSDDADHMVVDVDPVDHRPEIRLRERDFPRPDVEALDDLLDAKGTRAPGGAMADFG